MKSFALALTATLVLSTAALAQAATSGEDGAGAAGGGGKMKEMVKACRQEAKASGVKAGHDLNQAIADCVVKQKPQAAARMQCRVEGLDKGLKPGDELKSFIKDCVKQKHGA